jgi:hypothetical protein
MGEQQMLKRLLYAKTGRIRHGKPRARWLDEVNKDARIMGIRRWRTTTLDEEEWKRLLAEARILEEL